MRQPDFRVWVVSPYAGVLISSGGQEGSLDVVGRMAGQILRDSFRRTADSLAW